MEGLQESGDYRIMLREILVFLVVILQHQRILKAPELEMEKQQQIMV